MIKNIMLRFETNLDIYRRKYILINFIGYMYMDMTLMKVCFL